MDRYKITEGNLNKNEYIFFEFFKVRFFFFLKEGTKKNIQNHNLPELAHCTIVF